MYFPPVFSAKLFLKIVTSIPQILVTVNYRLGPLGFLSTSNDDIPANLGLWDQNLALKWVQNNIKDFGGNPDQVKFFNHPIPRQDSISRPVNSDLHRPCRQGNAKYLITQIHQMASKYVLGTRTGDCSVI
jgi:hypothetical protein